MNDRKDRVRVHINGQEFNVVGGTFQEMLSAIKQINGRRFVSELKVWQLPGTPEDIQRQLDISGYRLEEGAPVTAKAPAPQAQPSGGGGDRVRVLVSGHRLAVSGGSFQEMLALVKNLPNRRFNSETKLWEISGDVGAIKGMIEAAGFHLEGAEKIRFTPAPPMEQPDFSSPAGQAAPPPFEEPNFTSDDEIPEPPDWLRDQLARPPDEEEEYFEEPPFFDFEPRSAPRKSEPKPPASIPMASGGKRGGDRIRVRSGEVMMVVSGGSFQDMLSMIKGIPGRRFDSTDRVWEIPSDVSLESLGQRVAAAGFVLEQE